VVALDLGGTSGFQQSGDFPENADLLAFLLALDDLEVGFEVVEIEGVF
jgi:hypothetical protein